jgi:hypothetical protein
MFHALLVVYSTVFRRYSINFIQLMFKKSLSNMSNFSSHYVTGALHMRICGIRSPLLYLDLDPKPIVVTQSLYSEEENASPVYALWIWCAAIESEAAVGNDTRMTGGWSERSEQLL